MNATLLAMTNSAAESFIIMNSIFFGVSDIGISTVVQQAAFYSFIVQSKSIPSPVPLLTPCVTDCLLANLGWLVTCVQVCFI